MHGLQPIHYGSDIGNGRAYIVKHRLDDVFRQIGIGGCAHDRPCLIGKLLKPDELAAGKEADFLL
ncbi:hypothetical protein GCM10007160_20980 [Litchfieldella qijiaojingensis]|uniref:Uncharacterized protein n=1 Tax=Litchfieldella qijiaojingensis TaxID=980347 RepID=A0ABQ2YSI9_9GAMM|nr:hypothetical protein GCM10007160_20980 [Halomonas qijiaojingensis]